MKGEKHLCLGIRRQGIPPLRVHRCRIIRVSASSWKPLSALMSMFGREHLTLSFSSNPPPTIMILLAGAPARSFSERNRARSALFTSKTRQLDQDFGSGTEPSSNTLRKCKWLRERFFVVAHLIDLFFY